MASTKKSARTKKSGAKGSARKVKKTKKAGKAGKVQKAKKTKKTKETKKVKEVERLKKAEQAPETKRAREAEKLRKAEQAGEAKRIKEAEKLNKAEQAAEAKRAKEAEKLNKAAQAAEAKRVQEAEKLNKAEQAAEAKRAKETEKLRKAEQAAEAKRVQEAEKLNKAEQAAEAKRVQEAEKLNKAEQAAEAKRIKEAEKLKKAEQAAEAKRVQEAEKLNKAEQAAEAKRVKEAEKLNKAEQAAEAKRVKEAEKLNKAEQAAEAKRVKEAEKLRKAEEAAEAKRIKEAQKLRKAEDAAEAKRAKEAEKLRKAQDPSKPRRVRKGKEAPRQQPSLGTDKPRYYLTTAIAYPNGVPHIGFAYELIATDAIARFMRHDGYDVYFLTGTDEHGIKMLQTAAKEHITPQQLTARTVPRFRALAERMNCSNDDFIRTTEERHHRSSEAIWQRMEANGDIYLDKYSGWYSVRDEAYYDEEETRLDEKGVRLGPQGTPVEWVEEESYFFRLSAYQQKLSDLYEKQPDFVLPKERLNEVSSFVRGGLQDLSISRTTFDWGIPVPGTNPQGRPRTTNAKHGMYVWVDALTNYITGVGYPDEKSPSFRRFWPADLHVIGKDIVRFHAVYWPAFLMSAGIALPKRVHGHGFLFNRGEKMSKSVGNVVDPFALADAYGIDQLRYFLLREVPFGQDGTYSHEAIINRINADLANDLGNLAQRSLTMVARQLGGALPAPSAFSENDKVILAAADAMVGKAREAMKTQQLHQVLNAAWAVVADANRYFAGEAPWALAKTDPVRQGTVLYVTAEVIRQVAILAQPFMPISAAKLLDLLAIPADERDFTMLGSSHRVAPGTRLPAPAPVFPRYIDPEPSAPAQ